MTSQEFAIRRLTAEIESLDVTRRTAQIALQDFESWQSDNPAVATWYEIIDRNADIRASLVRELKWVRSNAILILGGDDIAKLRGLAGGFEALRGHFGAMHECFQRPAPSEAAEWEKFRTKAVRDLGELMDVMKGIAGDLRAMLNQDSQTDRRSAAKSQSDEGN